MAKNPNGGDREPSASHEDLVNGALQGHQAHQKQVELDLKEQQWFRELAAHSQYSEAVIAGLWRATAPYREALAKLCDQSDPPDPQLHVKADALRWKIKTIEEKYLGETLSEAGALRILAQREIWGIDQLPQSIGVDLLLALDHCGWIEARFVTMWNTQKFPGDVVGYSPVPSEWYSPIKVPSMAGEWKVLFAKQSRDATTHPAEVRVSQSGQVQLSRWKRELEAKQKAKAGDEINAPPATKPQATHVRRLRPCVEKAGKAMETAVEKVPHLIPETGATLKPELYDWIMENCYAGKLPSYETFCRYIREYYQGDEPATRIAGERVTSPSTVRAKNEPKRK